MSLRVLLRPLARTSVLVTFGALTLVAVAIKIFDREFRGDIPFAILLVVYNSVVAGLLISFGRFLGRITVELEGIRISRTIPGLRRKVNQGILILVLLVPAFGTLFLGLNVPEQFAAVPALTQWSLEVFLFSLGLGFRGWWLMSTLLSVLLLKLPWLLSQFRAAPSLSAIVALVAAGVLLAIRHSRFLAPALAGEKPVPNWSWRNFSPRSLTRSPRRSEKALRDRPGWRLPDIGVIALVRAGSFERLGHQRGRQLGVLAIWVMYVFLGFGLLAYAASGSTGSAGFVDFAAQLFTGDEPGQRVAVLRHLFAALTGGVAYVAAVTLDGTLRPNLWHPVSRRRQAATVFLSHLRQNFRFAAILVVAACGLVAVFARVAESPPGFTAIRAFVMPALIAFVLMPIPQALFPNGTDAFHRRVNPLKQLAAGVLGGGFSLLTIYWASYWPLKEWQAQMPLWLRATLMTTLGLAVYGGYFMWLRYRYARFDLRSRGS